MHILIGLALACGVLYLWLLGHWFGRVLMFLLLAVVCGLAIGIAMPQLTEGATANPWGFLIGLVVAWPLASIPLYMRRNALGY